MATLLFEITIKLFDFAFNTGTKDHDGISTGAIAILSALIGAGSGIVGQMIASYLSSKRETRMFTLSNQKEDKRYFSKLVGEIISNGYSYKMEVASTGDINAYLAYYKGMHNNEKFEEYKVKKKSNVKICRKHKADFVRLLGEYNYYHKDSKLDELIRTFSETDAFEPFITDIPITDISELTRKRREEMLRIIKTYYPLIDNIIKHLKSA